MERLRNLLSPILNGSKQTRQIAALGGALCIVVMISIVILVARGGDDEAESVNSSWPFANQPETKTKRASTPVDAQIVARLAAVEVALGGVGFVPSGEASVATVAGAVVCDAGEIDGLQVRTCIFSSADHASTANTKVDPTSAVTTSVVIRNRDALLWIVDEDEADPEGRRIQEVIDAFAAIE